MATDLYLPYSARPLAATNGHDQHAASAATKNAADWGDALKGSRAAVTGAGSVGWGSTLAILSPLNDNLQWRQLGLGEKALDKASPAKLLELLCNLSPVIAKGLADFVLFCNPGWEYTVTRPGADDDTDDPTLKAALDAFIEHLKRRYGSLDIPIGRLFTSAFLRGALFAELVLDRTGRMPIDLATPDPAGIEFRKRGDPDYGSVWVLGQYQSGQWVSIDQETVRYLPVMPLMGSPYGRPIVNPSLYPTLFAIGILHDVRRMVAHAGLNHTDLSVDATALQAVIAPATWADDSARAAAIQAIIGSVSGYYGTLQPDDAYVHLNTITVGRAEGNADNDAVAAVDGLLKLLKGEAVEGMGSMPFLHGMPMEGSEAAANRVVELNAKRHQVIQHLGESLLEYLFELALQVQGLVGNVTWRFAELRSAEELRDLQSATVKANLAAFQYAQGWLSQKSAANLGADVDVPDAPGPRVVAVAPPRTPDPTTEPEPGSKR